jgi:signal transduction histidine kinase
VRQDRTIRAQVDDLRALQELKDDLVSLMVHDLRSPLTGLLSYLDILDAEQPSGADDLREGLRDARQSGRALRDVLEDILEVRRLEENRLPLARRPVPLGPLAERSLASVRPAARVRGVSLELEDGGVPPASVDERLVQRALENLLTNAVRHSPRGKAVSLRLRAARGEAVLDVADAGPGVPESNRERIFGKFARLDPSAGGFGLGLYLVQLVASAHGGTVRALAGDGGGAVFRLVLPRG